MGGREGSEVAGLWRGNWEGERAWEGDGYCDLGFRPSDVVVVAWTERAWTKRHPTVWERDKSRGFKEFEREKTCLKKKKNYLFLGQITNTTKFIVFGQISNKFYLYFFLNYFNLNQNS